MKKSLCVVFVFLLSGCAVGNQYDYTASPVVLPVEAFENRILILSVADFRPYVLNGDKDADFVGLQRGGFGNPFDVTTTSGRAMTEDMYLPITQAFRKAGYRVINAQGELNEAYLANIAAREGADRIVLLQVHDWKSDIFRNMTLHCDLRLRVYDANAELLAESNADFVREIGGGHMSASKHSEIIADEFGKQIGYLFNKEEVRSALR